MNQPTAQNVSDLLAALSEPLRLRALRVLESEELSVGEIGRVLQVPQSTVSRHLRTLLDGGWVLSRTEGTSTLYRLLMDELSPQLRDVWLAVRSQLGGTLEAAEDRRRLDAVIAERREDTRAFFGRIAGEWDGVRNELFGDRATLRALLPLIPPTWTVADLGCGTGNAAELLAPCVERVIAVDQSPEMLDAARTRLGAYTNVEFREGDLEHLPLTDGAVDAAVCVLVLHHMNEPEAACREMARVLQPGGVLLIVDMIEHDRATYRHTMGHRWLGFGVAQMIRMLASAGLERTRFLTLAAETNAKGPGLFACTAYKPMDVRRAHE